MEVVANSRCSGTITSKIHGMVDANAYHGSRVTWPLKLAYVEGDGKLKSLKDVVKEKYPRYKQGMFTAEMGNRLVGLNTEMYNMSCGVVSVRNGRILSERDKKDIPSLIIAATMDMELAHVKGYDGEFIYQDDEYFNNDDALVFQGWNQQISDMEVAAESNPLRHFPLFSYDPRRYRHAENVSRNSMVKGCESWKYPFARIVGCEEHTDRIKKIWFGFSMNPVLGFRPFDEFCEYLPDFYKKCEDKEIPIIAYCAPEGIIAHEAKSGIYFKQEEERAKKRAERHEMILEKGLSNSKDVQFNSDMYYGAKPVVNDSNLDRFYWNYGHPNNWGIVLSYFPKLHLCLAGFGGNTVWGHKSVSSWVLDYNKNEDRYKDQMASDDKFKELAAIEGGEWIHGIIQHTKNTNVYTDISGLDINNPDVRNALKTILLLAFKNDANYKHLKNKIIFGSGGYMALEQNLEKDNYTKYCDDIKRLFTEVEMDVKDVDSSLKAGEIWEQVSLINPWKCYSLSKQKFRDMHKVLPGADDEESISSKTLRVLIELDDYIVGKESPIEQASPEQPTPVNESRGLREALGDYHYGKICELIKKNASRVERKLFALVEHMLMVGNTEYKEGGKAKFRFDPVKGEILIDIEVDARGVLINNETDGNNRNRLNPYQATVHEIWHHIDSLFELYSGKYVPYSYRHKYNLLGNTIKEDIKDQINKIAKEIAKGKIRMSETARKTFFRELELLMLMRHESTNEYLYSGRDLYYLYDIIEGATYGDIGGHFNSPITSHEQENSEQGYWEDAAGEVNLSSEYFAGIGGVTVVNPNALKLLKDYFPKSYKIYRKIIKKKIREAKKQLISQN